MGGERGGWTLGHRGSSGLPARQPLYLWDIEGALFLGEWRDQEGLNTDSYVTLNEEDLWPAV